MGIIILRVAMVYEVELEVETDAAETDTIVIFINVTAGSTPVGGVVGSTICCKVPPSLCSSSCASLMVEKWQNYLSNKHLHRWATWRW